MDSEDALKYSYYDTNSPACFAGADAVFNEAVRHCPTINKHDVTDWLKKQRTYTLYRPTARRFPRLRTIPTGLNTDWQADLTLFNAIKDFNDNYKYILVCVDVLSRKIYAEPVKEKSAQHMRPAFDAIFERSGTLPWKLFTDRGLEFESREMLQYFEKKDILKFRAHTNKVLKATVAERANRTIKDRLYKYFSQRNTLRWMDVLQKIVDAINHSVCRSTGMRPIDVNEANAPDLRRRIYGDTRHAAVRKTKFNVGDQVRVVKKKVLFTKGLAPYSDVIYTVAAVLKHKRPVVYLLKDYFNRPLKGYFYEKELVKTVPFTETSTRIARISRQRMRNGRMEGYVQWLNHPPEYNTWEPLESLENPAVDRDIDVDAIDR